MKLSKHTSQATSASVNMSLPERWGSVVGGLLLTGTAIRRRSGGKMRLLVGAELIRRGVTGHSYGYQALGIRTRTDAQGKSVSVPYELGVYARAAITIAKPRAVVYQFWRNFENLPRVMKHLISVDTQADPGSHWIAEGPGGARVEWDAEIHNDVENELIAWRSLPGSEVDSAGSVRFKDAPGNRGTEVLVVLQYNPPAGLIGASIAKLFGRDAETEIESDLFRLKQYLEAGEVADTKGQPKGPSVSQRKPVLSEEVSGRKSVGSGSPGEWVA
jgi:uncharacterized membrane protein